MKTYTEFMEHKNNLSRNELFVLGRKVNYELPSHSGLKPNKNQFKQVANKLGISISLAVTAFDKFTYG